MFRTLASKSGAAPSAPVANRRLILARALMLLVGSISCFGVVYFTIINPDSANLDVLGYTVAALLAIGSLGYVISAIRLGHATDGIWRLAMAAALLRAGLSIMKVAYYGETEAVPFLVLDVLITSLLQPWALSGKIEA